MARESDLVTLNWWKNLRESKFSLEDIFTRDSPKRKELNLKVSYYDFK